MNTRHATMCSCTSAPHAVYCFRDRQNACHGNHINRHTPTTLCGCRVVGVPAHLHLVGTRRYADLTFSSSRLLCSPCTPHAQRRTPGGYSCGSSLLQVRRLVQHLQPIENRNQNSFRATRHAPNAKYVVMQCKRCSSKRVASNKKGQQSERVVSEARTLPVEKVVKLSSEAMPLHGAVRSKQRNETLGRIYQHRVAGRFVSARSAYCGVSRPTSGTGYLCPLVPTLCTLLISSLASSVRTDQALQKISFKKAGLNEPFLSVLRSAASKPHFSKYIAHCLTLPDRVGVEFRNAFILSFRHVLMQRNYSASWVLNKYTAPIKIHCVLLALAPFVAVVVQPHTTKSLTGGVLRTLLLCLYACRSLVVSIKGLVMSVAAPKLSSIAVPADDETSVKVVLVMQPLLLTVPQVAQVLNFSRSKVYELINADNLPVLRFGRSVRVRVSALERWLDLQEEQSTSSQIRRVA